MQWPGSDSQNGSLLPVTTAAGGRAGIIGAAAVNGFADEYGSSSRDHRAEPRLRPPNYIRATSAQSRGVADEFSHLSATEAAARLRTSLTLGLSTTEALIRLRDHGPNEIPHDPPEPLWRRFLGQFREPLIVLLLASAGASVLVGNTDDAVSITIAVTIVVTVAFVQEYRSERSIEALNHLVPNHAHLVRGVGPGPGAGAGAGSESVNAFSPAMAVLSPSPPWSSVRPADLADTTMSAAAAAAPTDEVLEAASSKVTAAQLVPGDLVLFTAGDRIPADVRVTRAIGLTIDASNLTGENEPVRITSEPSDTRGRDGATSGSGGSGGSSGNSSNIAYMGTLVRSGHGQGLVFATGGRTHFGTIATSVSGTESPRSPLQLSMDELGSQLSWFSFAVIGLISIVGWLQGKRLLDIFTISISLAVAAIPEGLPIIVTVTLALGVHRMARHNAIVRKMPKVETLGSVNVVCTDKTGTLTTNHMTTAKLWHFDAKDDAIGVDSDDEATDAKPSPAALRIMRIGNLANNARLGHGSHLHGGGANGGAAARAVLSSTGAAHATRWVGQPTDVAMLDLLDRFREHDARDSVGPRLSEAPFSSERKWMGITAGGFAYMKGAVDRVLDACESCVGADGREASLNPARRRQALEAAERMAEQGLRVLAFASGPAAAGGIPPDEEAPYRDLVFAGLVGMRDPARPGVGRSIRRLMRARVRVIMITGDAEATAMAIARQLGMPVGPVRPAGSAESGSGPTAAAAVVVRGDEMDQMSDDALARAAQTAAVFARANPDHKLRIVRALQARGDIVAMTGDGVNDAPALKRADIGIAMGLGGTDVAKEAADMILADDDFSTILQAIEEGKAIFSNIQNFLTFQLSTSAAGLSLVLVCTCLGFKNPLNAMQILWINIIMDGPPAQSLGVEAVDPDVMTRPPRRRNDPVLTRPLLARIATSAAVIMTGTLMVYSREMRAGGGAGGELTRRDTTMTFTAFVLFDMYNALTCRSEAKSVLRGEVGLLSNGLFNWAVALSLAGQLMVIYVPWLQDVFQTEALSLGDLAGLAVLCSAVFWTDEMRKWWKYGRRRGLGGRYSQAV